MSLNIFVSSVIIDFERERKIVAAAISDCGLLPILAENTPAIDASPRDACMQLVGRADAVVGIYGPRYGFVNSETGLSATEEEYRWAREGNKPVLAFVARGPSAEDRQQAFLAKVGDYVRGTFWYRYEATDLADLYRAVRRGLEELRGRECFPLWFVQRQISDFALESWTQRYIQIDCEDEKVESRGAAVPMVLSWAQSRGGAVLVVRGETGSGKTSLCRKVAAELAQRYIEANHEGPIGVFVPLRRFSVRSEQADIFEYLSKQTSLSPADIVNSLCCGKAVLFLDGLDEVQEIVPSAAGPLLNRWLPMVGATNFRAVITVRAEFISSDDLRTILTRLDLTTGWDDTTRLVRTSLRKENPAHPHVMIRLLPLANAAIDQYFEAAGKGFLWAKQKGVYDFQELASRPILLRFIDEILPELRGNEIVTQAALYRLATTLWHKRNRGRLRVLGEWSDILSLVRQMAFFMGVHRAMTVKAQQLLGWASMPCVTTRNWNLPELAFDVRTCSFLATDSEEYFSFAHRSFQEYFLAEYIVELARTSNLGFEKYAFVDYCNGETYGTKPLYEEGNIEISTVVRNLILGIAIEDRVTAIQDFMDGTPWELGAKTCGHTTMYLRLTVSPWSLAYYDHQELPYYLVMD